MQTLFDLSQYHIEPVPDPSRPTAAKCLELISEAEAVSDLYWLEMFQHHVLMNHERYTEAELEQILERREAAARTVAGIFGRVG